MGDREAAPEMRGVTVTLLATVDLADEIEAWRGANSECAR